MMAFAFSASAEAAGFFARCSDGSTNCNPRNQLPNRYRRQRRNVNFRFGIFGGELDQIGDVTGVSDIFLNATQAWSDVTGARINLGVANRSLRLNSESDVTSAFNPSEPQGFNVAIIDNTGTAIDNLFGSGGSDNILGIGGPTFARVTANALQIIESKLIVNGTFFTSETQTSEENQTDAALRNAATITIIHELGHTVGLDHTQITDGDFSNSDGESNANAASLPVMFPTLFDFNNQSPTLKADDQSSIANGYRQGNRFRNNYGIIRGRIKNGSGRRAGLTGFVVVAYDPADPLNTAVASPADIRGRENGLFSIAFPTTGSTTVALRIARIGGTFTGASSIGRYNTNQEAGIPAGYLNGSSIVLEEDPATETGRSVSDALALVDQSSLFAVEAGSTNNIGTIDISDFSQI